MATVVIRLPSLAHANPIVLPDGRPSPYFQRFWQNISITATDGGQAGADISSKVDKNQSAGWGPVTGTGSKATFTTYVAPGISNPPTQAEVQLMANYIQILTEHIKAIEDGLLTAAVFAL